MDTGPRKKLVRSLTTVGIVLAIVVGGGLIAYNWKLAQDRNRLSRAPEGHRKNAPFMTSPDEVVELMLELGELDADDVVYDLGCGDGRILIAAAREYGCRGVGYEYDPEIAQAARQRVAQAGLSELVTIHQGDIFEIPREELNKATVITLYLLDWMNNQLIPQLQELDDGKIIVSHEWGLKGFQPDETRKVIPQDEQKQYEHVVYMWRTPLTPAAE